MGRPDRVEGNPAHPAQPWRGRASTARRRCWTSTIPTARRACCAHGAGRRHGRRLLGEMLTQRAPAGRHARRRVSHPDRARDVAEPGRWRSMICCGAIPKARWHQWEPVSRDNVRRGAELAYGQARRSAAACRGGGRDLGAGQRPDQFGARAICAMRATSPRAAIRCARRMSRVYAAEPVPTLIGGAADHRFIAGPRGDGRGGERAGGRDPAAARRSPMRRPGSRRSPPICRRPDRAR